MFAKTIKTAFVFYKNKYEEEWNKIYKKGINQKKTSKLTVLFYFILINILLQINSFIKKIFFL